MNVDGSYIGLRATRSATFSHKLDFSSMRVIFLV